MKKLDVIKKENRIMFLRTDEDGGVGSLQSPFDPKITLDIVYSNGMGWDHVSVSTIKRCPTWEEMNYIKNIFFNEDECAIQFHPPKSQYVNMHPYCLHIWKPQNAEIITPPTILLGYVTG